MADAQPFSDADLITRVVLHDDRNAFAELVRRGYSKADLAKIAQGNTLRVMRGVETAAGLK